jgi:Flp pilus assembly pilin Flp
LQFVSTAIFIYIYSMLTVPTELARQFTKLTASLLEEL